MQSSRWISGIDVITTGAEKTGLMMGKIKKTKMTIRAAVLAIAATVSLPAAIGYSAAPAAAASIAVVVNDQAITSYDVDRRAAFLKLQRRSGNLRSAATDELIDEALKRSAVQRAGYRIPDKQVDEAYANFAKSNNMSTSQLTNVLNQSGVTSKHFKEFIRLQIGWGYTVRARNSATQSLMSEQEVVAKMLEQGGDKPTSTEYTLQQVIFVVPQGQRSKMSARRTEANNLRGRLNGCDGTFDKAKQLHDVTVRDLGRFLELQLPDNWSDEIKGLQTGQTTRVKDTERGVEFIIVCNARSVSDDRVAQLEFSTKNIDNGGEAGAQFLEELRKGARIQRR